PSIRILPEPLTEKRAVPNRLQRLGAFSSETLSPNGFGGSLPPATSFSNTQPLTSAMTSDNAINASVQPTPIRPNRIKVNDKEFHGLAIRNAITCPVEAPRS